MTNNGAPYIDDSGNLIIPFSTDQKYHYWNGGQPLLVTLAEMNITKDIWGRHTEKSYPENVA
jgi:hypothetical protein